MIRSPSHGQVVQVWYRAALRPGRPLHALTGVVEAAARGPGPRNHAVRVAGVLHSIPAGQLRTPPASTADPRLWGVPGNA